uniref:Phosphatidic acid phosphatase type 2/haloperoxidase domain-containing protein n=2 Tax=Nymphaea colorata TaxID=210225 RepID=A0A5K1DAX7_9MAGN
MDSLWAPSTLLPPLPPPTANFLPSLFFPVISATSRWGKERGREMALKAVTLTHVRYEREDKLGHFLAWVSLLPVFISLGGFVSHILLRRELHPVFFFIGLILSHLSNDFVKDSVKQSRPHTCEALEFCDSHGWPSSHSNYMFFFAVYLTLLRLRCRPISKCDLAVALGSWTLAFLTMFSRVYLGYHTVGQVVAGAGLGIVLGGTWFWIVNSVIAGCFPAIEESAIGRFFYIKDTSHIRNVLKFEYENARAARKAFQRKEATD